MQLVAPIDACRPGLAPRRGNKHGKLLDPVRLNEMLELYDPAPLHSDDLEVDTSTSSPAEAAETVTTVLT